MSRFGDCLGRLALGIVWVAWVWGLSYAQIAFTLFVLHVIQEKIMAMLTLRIDDKLNDRITALAQKTGRTKTYFIKKLLVEAIDDLEDELWAIAAFQDLKAKEASGYKRSYISHEELIKELGLDVELDLRTSGNKVNGEGASERRKKTA